ncbi:MULTISPECIES: TrbI/VirB10 family protein [Paracoccus]|uniref:TrbI/VirB10 family protein n=1 Tax=Paracoccus TaxID=265 RepID=UPI000DF7C6B9|nr:MULTISPECIES: TrbI/VirB10 family protein [Paracoccus]MBT0779315.1 TrbI/VirB10 family protein [Paracoccus sp. pheM1]RDD70075.1 conjugal transfer protein TraI [Paracoccus versutus]
MSDRNTSAAPMRLRAEPPRVTRLSRKVLAGMAAIAALGIGAALIFALQSKDVERGGEELFSTENRATADGLAELPHDYSGPALGPALPGDLGKPILNARNRGAPVPAPATPTVTTPAMGAVEQQRLAEEEAARLSGVFFQGGSRPAGGPDAGAGSAGPVPGGSGSVGQMQTAGPQDRHAAFLGAAADRVTVAPDRVEAPASPYLLQAGSVIPAALITGIRSDLPGQIIAQVTQPVYDSPTGSILLIPQGTRIIGEYDAGVAFGQRRVLLVWNRLIFPDGRSLVLERLPGTDASGYAGLEDGVDYHWGDMAKAAGLSTILAIGTEIGREDDDPLVRAIREGAGDTIADSGQQIVQRQLQVPPTLTIRPGFPVRILVGRDLVFENAGG